MASKSHDVDEEEVRRVFAAALHKAVASLSGYRRVLPFLEHAEELVDAERQRCYSLRKRDVWGYVLPRDISLRIFAHLDAADLTRASAVCRLWNRHSKTDRLWRELYRKRFGETERGEWDLPGATWMTKYAERHRIARNWRDGRFDVKLLDEHVDSIVAVCCSSDFVLTFSADCMLRTWDPLRESCLTLTEAPYNDESFCVFFDGRQIVTGTRDSTVTLWDVSQQAMVREFTGHTDIVTCVQADERYVVSGSMDRTVRVWDAKHGRLERTIEGHTGTIKCLQFCSDERRIMTGSEDRSIRIWDLDSGEMCGLLAGHEKSVLCLAFDKHVIVSGAEDIRVWSRSSMTCTRVFTPTADVWFTRVLFDAEHIVCTSSDSNVYVYDRAMGEKIHELRGQRHEITCLDFDVERIVTGSTDGTVKVWDFAVPARGMTERIGRAR